MILNDNEIETRLESPLNLLNKLNGHKKKTGMEIFVPSSDDSNGETPAAIIDSLVDDNKIKLGHIKSRATDILHDSLIELHGRLNEVNKVRDLSSIAREMKSILTEDESSTKTSTQVVIYKPIINDINKYETLVVVE